MIHRTTKKTVLDGKTVLLDFGLDAFANLDVVGLIENNHKQNHSREALSQTPHDHRLRRNAKC